MPTCSLCESTQTVGDACDVCGRPFPASQAAPLPVPRLAELEVTLFPPAGDVPVARIEGLEPTADAPSAGGGDGPPPVEGFSPTGAAPVTVDVEPLDIDRVIDEAVLEPAWAPRTVACRYCLTPAAPGERLCTRCGMQLPLERPPPGSTAAGAHPCSDCGVPMTGAQCPACGARR